jgi:hypothetical protein
MLKQEDIYSVDDLGDLLRKDVLPYDRVEVVSLQWGLPRLHPAP